MFKRLFTAALLLGVAGTAPPLYAQQLSCSTRASVAERLSDKYNEHVVAGGLQNSERLVEVWASPETGTFTIIMTTAEGLSCIVASGTNYHQSQLAPSQPDSKS